VSKKGKQRSEQEPLSPPVMEPDVLGDWLAEQRNHLLQQLPGADIFDWMRRYTASIDESLQQLYAWAWARTAAEVPLIPEHALAILATGGYGRSELAPYSDIDLTFVPMQDGDPFTERLVKHLFQALMDVLHTRIGLRIGYAYRLVEDCSALDDKTRTGLLDMRIVAGSPAVAVHFEQAFQDSFEPTGFLFDRYHEYLSRLERHGHGVLRVEMNLKEGAGGLRDYHTLCWMAQVRYQVPGGQALNALTGEGLLSRAEAKQLVHAYQDLSHLRALLHMGAGEARDLFTRTRHDEIAERLKEDSLHRVPPQEGTGETLESLFEAQHTLYELCRCGIEGLIRTRLLLSHGLDSLNGEIVPAGTAGNFKAAGECLEVFRLQQRYRLSLSLEMRHRIRQWVQDGQAEFLPHETGNFFVSLFSLPGSVYPVLREMADLGVLQAAIPAFGRVWTLLPGDSTHEYTVGEHTLQAIRLLDDLTRDTSDEFILLRTVLEQVNRPELLYMAVLMHDVGKWDASRPHSESGAEIAEAICRDWGWDEGACAGVEFMVRHHLLMAQTARVRDLHLDSTIREFTQVMDDVERLQMLYLLTCVDTRAVGERIWVPTQAVFLYELYRRSLRVLEGEIPDVPNLTTLRKQLIRKLSKHPVPEASIEAHVAQMPSSYLLNVPPEQMTLHIHYVERAREGEPVIEFHNAPQSPYTEMTICTLDDPRPGLLSKIAGVLYAQDIEVQTARVFTREEDPRIALDTLWIDTRHRPLSSNQCVSLERVLRSVLTGEQSVETLLSERKKQPDVPFHVYRLQFRSDTPDTYTMIEMQMPIDTGALYRSSRVLSGLGWNIHSARLGQWAGRTVIGFYVTDSEGNNIAPEQFSDLHSRVDLVGDRRG
jgi:[protein-PII] uridylyltransferase